MKNKILVMFSGGQDSAWILDKILTSHEYKEYDVEAHHINIRNVERRAVAESVAVENIYKYMDAHYRTFDKSFSDITTPARNRQFMFDSDVINYMAGYLCSVDPTIKIVAMGVNKTDLEENTQRFERSNKIFETFTTNVQKIFPAAETYKEDIFKTLNKELLDLTWSCRTPVYSETDIQSCGKCKSCKQIKEYSK